MNYGFIAPKIETLEEGIAHVLGGEVEAVNASGDWLPFIPDREPQNVNGVETNACTVYATQSALETFLNFKGSKANYSDRYVANVAKNQGILNPSVGADPHKIAELLRKTSGNTAEALAPWATDYYNLDVTPLIPKALEWYKEWQLTHEWVFTGGTPEEKRAKIQIALRKGVVCASVSAWHKKDGVYYKPKGAQDNHWTTILQARESDPYKCFDSYDTYVKDLDPLYDFGYAKVYYLTPAPHTFLTNLYYGITNPEVIQLQKALVELGYPIINATTDFYGVQTRYAVSKFQVEHGILGNAGQNFGPKTRYEMNKAMNPDTNFGGSFSTFIQSLFASA